MIYGKENDVVSVRQYSYNTSDALSSVGGVGLFANGFYWGLCRNVLAKCV